MFEEISNANERLHERRISETGTIPAPVAIDEEESSSPPDQEIVDIASGVVEVVEEMEEMLKWEKGEEEFD